MFLWLLRITWLIFDCSVIVSLAIKNHLVYILGFWSMIVIVSYAVENNLVYLRAFLVGPMIMIVSWAIENNLVYFWDCSGWVYDCDSFLGY